MLKLLEQEPDYSKVPDSLPPVLREVLERCLQKDPAKRLRDIGDVRVMLESGRNKPVKAPVPTKRVRWMWFGGAVILAAVLAAGFFFLRPKAAPPVDPVRFEIAQPGNTTLLNVLAISPDGRRLAFIASPPGQPPQLWVRSLETLEARPLDDTSGVSGLPFWSADSHTLVFSSQGKLSKVDASGGPVQTVANWQGPAFGGMWTLDNRIVVGSEGGLLQVPAAGGTLTPPQPLPWSGPGVAVTPSLLPDGRHFVFTSGIATLGNLPGVA